MLGGEQAEYIDDAVEGDDFDVPRIHACGGEGEQFAAQFGGEPCVVVDVGDGAGFAGYVDVVVNVLHLWFVARGLFGELFVGCS